MILAQSRRGCHVDRIYVLKTHRWTPVRFFCACVTDRPCLSKAASGGEDFSAAEEGNEAAVLGQARAVKLGFGFCVWKW